jgi:hypothetical protein
MKAVGSTETSVLIYKIVWRYIPEDHNFYFILFVTSLTNLQISSKHILER